ncbi:MAG: SusC/RagA family TonB-linked outer membrane protein [Bacteroidaceae bacterium]|nr:SusC/RagA family TonB-linked outer membrane protein [Bacteroidaceae bacterium]
MKLLKSVAKSLLVAAIMGTAFAMTTANATAATAVQQQQYGTAKGTVVDENGEPVFGAVVFVVGTTNSTSVDFDGNFELANVKKGEQIRVMLMGYTCDDQVWNGQDLKFVMKEETTVLDEIVVTAMGIMRKEKSLTYATQLVKADDLLKAPDANIVNSLEGKISGITITPSAGGAGGASKITLRGNKSISGENSPLIVVDGVPMTNSIRNQASDPTSFTSGSVTEGSDYMSMINPDDIESMNVLKGANAAALYGSRAANGVIMITTKKGKEGKMEVTFTSNTTFDTPLLTPRLQNAYGAHKAGNISLEYNSWGDRLSGSGTHVKEIDGDKRFFYDNETANQTFINNVHLRNYAKDDIAEFYDTGIMTTNSIGVSGGTEKIQTYASYSNTYSQGMIKSNRYDRNTFAFRQSYKLWDRLTLGANINYVQTKTRNRVGGGTVGNPIYHLYTTPRDTDMDYYKENYEANGQWYSSGDPTGKGEQVYYVKDGSSYKKQTGHVLLTGPMQNYSYMSPGRNNPYWLTNKNYDESIEDRFSVSFNGTLKIIEGLNLAGRVSLDHSKYNNEGGRYATTWYDVGMYRYGSYWLSNSRTNDFYADAMLSYNKEFAKDWSVSATAGFVAHTTNSNNSGTYVADATIDMTKDNIVSEISSVINRFEPSSGSSGVTSKGKSNNWDKAALATAQIGWRDVVFVDASYRHDWYRPFKQFAHLGTKESYGYFGVGANAVLSDLIKLPRWWNYAKYRLSYSEVGNSIPNIVYSAVGINERDEAVGVSSRNSFTPEPEKTKSFETGLEMQFFRDCLNVDITYYNSAMHKQYIEVGWSNGKIQPINSGIIRNQGIELTIGYDWKINKNWRWKTSANFSYNHNRIEATAKNEKKEDIDLVTSFAKGKVQIAYKVGGSYGDIYVNDFTRYANNVYQTADGKFNTTGEGQLVHKKGDIYLTSHLNPNTANVRLEQGRTVTVDKWGDLEFNDNGQFATKIGNANSPCQLSWSNTFTYKDFTLYFLINGRIGGKVISLTERELDRLGASERTGEARLYAEKNNIRTKDGSLGMYLNDNKNDIIAIRDYYEFIGTEDVTNYIYDATNFRLRELSLGYTFRNLFGDYKNLSISFVCRNLFFIYKEAPVDPDVSLSTANGLGGIDMFNYPSSRSFGLNIKLNL